MRTALIFLLGFLSALTGCQKGPVIGKPLDSWTEGSLEIHSINTGRGESFFYILPDGTTLLIDASGANPLDDEEESHGHRYCPAKPSEDVSSGEVVAEYIRHFMPNVADGTIDYSIITHYHGDHMGVVIEGMDVHPEGGFIVSGITEVGSKIKIRTAMDRGDVMDPPSKNSFSDRTKLRYGNYLRFLEWSKEKYGTERVVVTPGALDQIALRHAPREDFHIRMLAAGGRVWDGAEGTVTRLPSTEELLSFGPSKNAAHENILSVALHLKYGNFDWYTGGDCQYRGRSTNEYNDIEEPISKVMGHVEGMKADHHATNATNSPELLAALTPDFVIAGTWKENHPNPETVKRFFAANPEVKFMTTNFTEATRKYLTDEGVDPETFLAKQGHIVVRVAPGGFSYTIFILDDSDTKYRVAAIHGPFTCKP